MNKASALSRALMIATMILCGAAGSTAVIAQSSIKVIVNDIPITSYDISQRSKLMRLGGVKGGEKAATEELIDEALQMAEARRRGLSIPDAQVDRAFGSIAQGLKMSAGQLTKALASEGIDADSLKKRLRAQLSWGELVQARMRRAATVKSSDVTAALLAKGPAEGITMKEFVLQQIIFVVPEGSSSGFVAQRRREAEGFRQRFKGCDQSIAQAKTLKSVVVKDIGRRDSSQFSGAAGEEISKTPEGKTVRPFQTDAGIELIAVCTVRDIQSNAAARAEVENQLALAQNKDLGKDYLKELRDKAVVEHR